MPFDSSINNTAWGSFRLWYRGREAHRSSPITCVFNKNGRVPRRKRFKHEHNKASGGAPLTQLTSWYFIFFLSLILLLSRASHSHKDVHCSRWKKPKTVSLLKEGVEAAPASSGGVFGDVVYCYRRCPYCTDLWPCRMCKLQAPAALGWLKWFTMFHRRRFWEILHPLLSHCTAWFQLLPLTHCSESFGGWLTAGYTSCRDI